MRTVPLDREHIGGVAALLVVTAALGYVAGPLGVVAGLAVALVWWYLSTPYAIAAGHLALVAVTAGDFSLGFLLAEAGFALLVASDATNRRTGAVAIGLFSGLVLLTQGLYTTTDELWLTAGGLTLAVAVLAYGLHRYELVRMGLVEADT